MTVRGWLFVAVASVALASSVEAQTGLLSAHRLSSPPLVPAPSNTVWVDPGGGCPVVQTERCHASLDAALSWVASQAPSFENRWRVEVGSAVLDLTGCVEVPDYTVVRGTASYYLVNAGAGTVLRNVNGSLGCGGVVQLGTGSGLQDLSLLVQASEGPVDGPVSAVECVGATCSLSNAQIVLLSSTTSTGGEPHDVVTGTGVLEIVGSLVTSFNPSAGAAVRGRVSLRHSTIYNGDVVIVGASDVYFTRVRAGRVDATAAPVTVNNSPAAGGYVGNVTFFDRATATSPGLVQLAGDLAGPFDAPEVRALTSGPVPTAAGDPGEEGAIAFDDDFLYVRTAVGWRRVALEALP